MAKSKVKFEIQYTSQVKEQLKSDDIRRAIDPYGRLAIYFDGEELAGPQKGYIVDYLGSLVAQLLDVAIEVSSGNQVIKRTSDDPLYLVFEPHTDGTVSFAQCYSRASAEDPEKRIELEQPKVTEKELLAKAIIEMAEMFVSTVLDFNPSVKSDNDFQQLEEKLEKTRRINYN